MTDEHAKALNSVLSVGGLRAEQSTRNTISSVHPS